MDAAVKWLYAADTEQQRPALCIIHENNTLCVQAGRVVRVILRPAKDHMGMRNVMSGNAPYPVSKAAAKLREVGQRIGITGAARVLLDAIEADDEALLEDTSFTDEEEITMLDDDENDENNEEGSEEAAEAPQAKPKRKLPPPRKPELASSKAMRDGAKKQAAAAAAKDDNKTVTTPVKGKKETIVATKKNVKAKAKVKAKVSAAPKKATTPGEGGFRAGSNMEKGFIAYKAARKEYQGFERGDKQAWAQKLADKLGTTLNSVRTMISKNWEPLLTK